jgi:hypothetical protein
MSATTLLRCLVVGSIIIPTLLQASETGVRIRFGIGDKASTVWDGTASVSPGKITHIDGWRFQQRDQVNGTSGWQASTRTLTVRRSNNAKKAGGAGKKGGPGMADNGVILLIEDATEDSVLKVTTAQGNFDLKLSDIPYGKIVEKLNGAVEVERVAACRPLSTERTDDDFPAVAVSSSGEVFVTWQSFTPGLNRDERARSFAKEPGDLSYLAAPTGGDQLWLRVKHAGQWGSAIPVTAGKSDIYKSAVTIDGKGTAWIVWAERRDDNFDIWARPFANGAFGETQRICSDPGSDVSPVAVTDNRGRVWIAWQGARDGVFRILERHQTETGWSEETRVSTQKGSCWQPALAAAKDGRMAVLWDTYDRGDYDVWLREYDNAGKAGEARPAANTDQYEARASAAYDQQGNLWISWEQSGQTWGKNWGAYAKDGIGLYRDRQIGLTVLTKDGFKEPAGAVAKALPAARPRRGVQNLPVRTPEPQVATRRPGQEAQERAATYNNLARLICDRDNRIWLFARAREGNFHTPLGSVWMNYATYFDGQQWVGPILLPHSDDLMYNLPAVAAHPDGGLVVAHSSDHRQDRHMMRPGANNASLESEKDPFDNDVFFSRMEFPAGKPLELALKTAARQPNPNAQPTAAMLKEREDVARVRNYRASIAGKELRILRGEFHRHTEISGDGGNDGPLEDMWRYGIDAASMDWLGCGDHDNGAGREYTWWLTQKTTDAFHLPGAFDPLFSYERSVRYPEGHRNVVFVQRGVRTLPRLPISARDFKGHAPDTQLLYRYLRQFDGICASHTSTTGMGTDWRDNDPVYEPMVEIYQGCRQNYERPGAPRSPTPDDAIGGWEPLGFVNLALLKGYRFSFESSSDHGSTHISYALVYAEEPSRGAIFKAMKARHTYGATDNILADYRCTADGAEHMMGDEFTSTQPPTVRCTLVGTQPFAHVVLIKDDVEVQSLKPNKAELSFTWTDPRPAAGKTSYYYVRGEQTDGELVWASPMWIKFQPR